MRRGALTAICALTVLLAASLLFLVQPMAARMLLPSYGGSPSVWTTCMLFFQVILFAGYCCAHALARLPLRWQVTVQAAAAFAAMGVLPFRATDLTAPADLSAPVTALLGSLLGAIGPPLLVLSATAPLLQRWFSIAGAPNPYVLYAASNLGSLAALLGYPFVVERLLPIGAAGDPWSQTMLWSLGYGAFAFAVLSTGVLTARMMPAAPASAAASPSGAAIGPAISWLTRLHWLALAFVPSSAMLGVTLHLTTDVAAVPLLWVIPLSLYLATYVIAFSGKRPIPQALARVAALALCAVVALLPFYRYRPHPADALIVHLSAFFFLALVLHQELWRSRPEAGRLTEFYLWVAAGGALGGVFNALVAPAIFDGVFEYPIVLVLGCLLAWRTRALGAAFAAALAGCFVAAAVFAGAQGRQIHAERTFFGVVRVMLHEGIGFVVVDEAGNPEGEEKKIPGHIMLHGTTRHGFQLLDEELRHFATTYYHINGPLGGVFRAFSRNLEDIGVVGLGTGTVAAYVQKDQRITFFEIDPAVARIAQDPRWFTYLADCRGRVTVAIADGRVGLASGPRARFDLLIVDGFTSDAIPVHLLTKEAFEVYLDALRPDGLLAIHATNRYFDLVPVVRAVAGSLGLHGIVWNDRKISEKERIEGKNTSDWVILSRSDDALAPLRRQTPDWLPLESSASDPRHLWTDDYASPLSVIKWE